MSETPAQTSAPEKKRSHSKKPDNNGQRPSTKAKEEEPQDLSPEDKMAAFVNRARKNWKEATENAKTQQEFSNKPDGNYILKLTGADYGVGGNGKLRIMWIYTCLEGKYLGETFWDFSNLEQEDAETWLANKLHRLGVDIDDYDPANLEATLQELVQEGSAYAVTLKSSPSKNDPDKTFQRFFINKKLGADYEPDISDDDNDDNDNDDDEGTMNKTKKKSAPVSTKTSNKKAKAEEEDEEDDDEEGEDDVEIEVGDTVSYDKGDKTYQGTVEEVDDDESMAKILLTNGKTVSRPFGILSIVEKAGKDDDEEEDEEDEEDEDDEDEEVDLEVGSKVEFRWKGQDMGPAVVKSIDAETGIVRVSYKKKVYPVKVDAISVLDDDDDDDDEDEKPAPKKGKK